MRTLRSDRVRHAVRAAWLAGLPLLAVAPAQIAAVHAIPLQGGPLLAIAAPVTGTGAEQGQRLLLVGTDGAAPGAACCDRSTTWRCKAATCCPNRRCPWRRGSTTSGVATGAEVGAGQAEARRQLDASVLQCLFHESDGWSAIASDRSGASAVVSGPIRVASAEGAWVAVLDRCGEACAVEIECAATGARRALGAWPVADLRWLPER